jgi:3-deoxy-D-manno-octulosonate 8-phosphate phosphatase (KDO 8-P phosphatase)
VTAIAARFAELGGRFLTDPQQLTVRLGEIRALVFDWDGVFNTGAKGHAAQSGFNEADSMGTNMLRYGLWRRDGDLPVTAIITGENNPSAESFATREHFHAVYTGASDKAEAIDRLCAAYKLTTAQIACVFDDINDIGMARQCGARFLVPRGADSLFQDYLTRNGCVDYATAASSGRFAVREVAELVLGLLGVFDAVVDSRVAQDVPYRQYFSLRQEVETQLVAATTA